MYGHARTEKKHAQIYISDREGRAMGTEREIDRQANRQTDT